MIVVVGPNGGMDHTVEVAGLHVGTVHRAVRDVLAGGGKGGNVARIAALLGADLCLVSFAGGGLGALMRRDLESLGIECRWVPTQESSRLCDIVVDARTHTSTVVNAIGPTVSASEWADLDQTVAEAIDDPRTRVVVLTGSVPPGVPASAYRTWTQRARARGLPVAVDASGELLREAVDGKPTLVKVNADELLDAWGGTARRPAVARERLERVKPIARELLRSGIQEVIVTDGGNGAYAFCGSDVLFAAGDPYRVISSVGCGDAFLAALVTGLAEGADVEQRLRLAVAAALGNLAHLGCGFPDGWDVRGLASSVQVRRVAVA